MYHKQIAFQANYLDRAREIINSMEKNMEMIIGVLVFIAGYITGVVMFGYEVFNLSTYEFRKWRKYWNETEEEQ